MSNIRALDVVWITFNTVAPFGSSCIRTDALACLLIIAGHARGMVGEKAGSAPPPVTASLIG